MLLKQIVKLLKFTILLAAMLPVFSIAVSQTMAVPTQQIPRITDPIRGLSRLPSPIAKTAISRTQPEAACENTSFYLHIPAPAGHQLTMTDLQSLPDGSFLLSGQIRRPDGSNTGFLMQLDQSGQALWQQQLRVDNQDCNLDDMSVSSDGSILLSGITRSIPGKAFLMKLSANFQPAWVRLLDQAAQPLRTFIGVSETGDIGWVSQSANFLHYGKLDPSGAPQWTRTTTPGNMTDLVGISGIHLDAFAIAIQAQEGGLPKMQYLEIDGQNGNILSVFPSGATGEQSVAGKPTHFNNRLIRLETQRDASGQFSLLRQIQYYPQTVETAHRFTIPGLNTLNVSTAMDVSGDLMGICIPTDNRLLLLKQFTDNMSVFDYAREFQVPYGSTLMGMTRAYNGGVLMGLNRQDASELIIIKTDSTGRLPGCGNSNPTVGSAMTIQVQNQVQSLTSQSYFFAPVTGTSAFGASVLTTRTDCFTSNCPPGPPADNCLSSYHRQFRSNSFTEVNYGYVLLANQRHLIATAKVDRINGTNNQVTYALKLIDDRGNYVRGVNLISPKGMISFVLHRIDDRSAMLVTNAYDAGTGSGLDITLVDDNLNMRWSKTINTGYEFYSSGMTIGDVHKDAEGNYYLVGTTLGFMEPPRCTVIKLDANGNLVWNKSYSWGADLFGVVSITSTPSSIVAIIEASSQNKLTVRLDKQTGEFKNAYRFKAVDQLRASFALYKHLFTYSDGHILYAGHGENEQFMMGVFDTTGRPIKLRMIQHEGSIMRAGTVHNGNIYATYYYYNGSGFSEALLKADKNLDLEFFRTSPMTWTRHHNGMAISADGSIYTSGDIFKPNDQYDLFVMKFDADGRMGTCTMQDLQAPIKDITLNPLSATPTLVPRDFPIIQNSLRLVDDLNPLTYAFLHCSSVANCNRIDIDGPGQTCGLNTDVSYRFRTNAGCSLRPNWYYDSSIAQLQSVSDSNAIFRFKKPGRFTLRASLQTGCQTFADSLQVNVQDTQATLNLGTDTLFCPGDSLRLTAGPQFSSYRWQDGSSDSVFVARQSGTYFVRATNGCGNVLTDTLVIRQANLPGLFIGADTTLCPGSPLELQATIGFAEYRWTTAMGEIFTGPAIRINPVSSALALSASATTAEGCTQTDSIRISVFAAQLVTLGPDQSICSDGQRVLDAGPGYASYRWNTGQSTQTLPVHIAGRYWLQATDLNGCTSSDTLTLTVNPIPQIRLGPDQHLCTDERLTLDPGNFSAYQWQDGSHNRSFTADRPGLVWVRVTDALGCAGTDSLTITAILPLPSDFLQASVSFCKYQDITLTPTRNFSAYRWSTGASQRTITIDRGGRYTLEVTDLNGCTGTDTIQVIENDCLTGVFIPNAFTPNNDNLNDRFQALVYGRVVSFQLQVYNRFGELVFATRDPRSGWDGFFKGKTSPAGTFVWQCRYQLEGAEPENKKGTVMLIR